MSLIEQLQHHRRATGSSDPAVTVPFCDDLRLHAAAALLSVTALLQVAISLIEDDTPSSSERFQALLSSARDILRDGIEGDPIDLDFSSFPDGSLGARLAVLHGPMLGANPRLSSVQGSECLAAATKLGSLEIDISTIQKHHARFNRKQMLTALKVVADRAVAPVSRLPQIAAPSPIAA